ncbi:hypothetical protein Poli38472_001466 [Pythium oligandrum]|uniref:Nitroreductase domain-containing protein n=1 Tax=Pythium oligandrum TaxID=41045 RepID=A0A8K1CTI1_PYTOL|nr:hypothetical protein Poli38472_001466 [Pythium oligandrum]|eukprot:TMW69310.1 hypothetical protein Poli38472_001466 [Pythium oligandrum]
MLRQAHGVATTARRSTSLVRRFKHGDAREQLRQLLLSRASARGFSPEPVPDDVLANVVKMTQRAPSAFNTQPYACILVRDQADRDRLAGAMLASNGQKVKDAPVVAVFAADLEPSRRVPRLQKMMYDNGASPAEVNNLPLYLRMFAGEGHIADGIRSVISTVISPLRAVPGAVPTIAWSFKQTTFAAATFLHAAESQGLVTRPMEGYDETRVRAALDIPDRYGIPVIIGCGYPKADAETSSRGPSPRLEAIEVFFDGKFGQSSANIFVNSKEAQKTE